MQDTIGMHHVITNKYNSEKYPWHANWARNFGPYKKDMWGAPISDAYGRLIPLDDDKIVSSKLGMQSSYEETA